MLIGLRCLLCCLPSPLVPLSLYVRGNRAEGRGQQSRSCCSWIVASGIVLLSIAVYPIVRPGSLGLDLASSVIQIDSDPALASMIKPLTDKSSVCLTERGGQGEGETDRLREKL